MPVQLSYGGASWRLPEEWTLERLQDEIKQAMNDRSALPLTLDGGQTLILNGALLGYVVAFDDHGDPSVAPSSWSQGSMTSSGTGSVISAYPGSVISSYPSSVISSYPGSVISSGAGSITISWSADPTGRGPW